MAMYNDIFSEANMFSYGRVCLRLAEDMPDSPRVHSKQFDTIVIPSRGAVPFLLGTLYALDKLAHEYEGDHLDMYEGISVQESMGSLLPPESRVKVGIRDKGTRIMIAPFTADLNIERFDPEQSSDEYTGKTRNYWANVVAAMFLPPAQRAKDPYFTSFVDVVLKDVEHRSALAAEYESFPQIHDFSMMDTVISGRAATEILKSFEKIAGAKGNCAIDPFAFLVVDEGGRKLRADYRRYLKEREVYNKAAIITTPRIVSEDKGASLLGVSAVVYPSIMRASKGLMLGNDEFFVGAGSWRLGNELVNTTNPYVTDFQRFMNLVYKSIDAAFVQEFTSENVAAAYDAFNQTRRDFVEYAERRGIYSHKTDESPSVLKLSKPVDGFFETGSRVGHVVFPQPVTDSIVSSLMRLPGVHPKPPPEVRKPVGQ